MQTKLYKSGIDLNDDEVNEVLNEGFTLHSITPYIQREDGEEFHTIKYHFIKSVQED